MDTEGSTQADTGDDPMADGRPVRVSYVAQGFGVALVIDDEPTDRAQEPGEAESGVLRVSDAVVTLEIPLPNGGRSVLSWDPAEVAFDPLVA